MLIGITGTLGAGKGTVVEYLAGKGFAHYSARAFIVEEVKKRGLPVDRDSMTEVGNALRAAHGPAYVIESLIVQAEQRGENSVIESVRTVGEVEVLKKKSGLLIAVDAEPRARYARAAKRGSETDAVSFEKFMDDEKRESVSDDPSKQNLTRVATLADFHLTNDGTIPELHRQVDQVLATVGRI